MPDVLLSGETAEFYEPPALAEVGDHADLVAGMLGNSWDSYAGLFLS